MQVATLLIDAGATLNIANAEFETPLHLAARDNHKPMVELLLNSGANANAVDTWHRTPMMRAAMFTAKNSIEALLKGGADIGLKNYYGRTVGHHAARDGGIDSVVFLMNTMKRHDLDSFDAFGMSTVMYAIERPEEIPIAFLLSSAPDWIPSELGQRNVLDIAIASLSLAGFRMLLLRIPKCSRVPLLNHRDRFGSPLYTAIIGSLIETIELLLDSGAELELEGSDHGTPLMAACAAGRLAAVKFLIARGARTSYSKDGKFHSAFSAARFQPEIRGWLLVGRFTEGPRLINCGV